MSFILEWFTFYAAIMFTMSIDNLFWIPTSPEYLQIKKKQYPVKVEGKYYYSLIDYSLRYRIWSVLTHWRDIIPAILTSFILTLIL